MLFRVRSLMCYLLIVVLCVVCRVLFCLFVVCCVMFVVRFARLLLCCVLFVVSRGLCCDFGCVRCLLTCFVVGVRCLF